MFNRAVTSPIGRPDLAPLITKSSQVKTDLTLIFLRFKSELGDKTHFYLFQLYRLTNILQWSKPGLEETNRSW